MTEAIFTVLRVIVIAFVVFVIIMCIRDNFRGRR